MPFIHVEQIPFEEVLEKSLGRSYRHNKFLSRGSWSGLWAVHIGRRNSSQRGLGKVSEPFIYV